MTNNENISIVNYTISGTPGQARLDGEELAALRAMASSNPAMVITKVRKPRIRRAR